MLSKFLLVFVLLYLKVGIKGFYMMELIKNGAPINGRQYYTEINDVDRKKYTYSIDASKADEFEKVNKQYDEVVGKDFMNNKTKTKIKMAGYIGALVGGTIPLALSLKCIKGT